MIILNKSEIEERIDLDLAAEMIEDAFRSASAGRIDLPPVGHITFPDHQGDCHIKYGHRQGDDFFVIKIATGFQDNDPADAPCNNGMSLVLSAETGATRAILHDEMFLTDVRTGIGGAIATRTLADTDATRMLVVGTGVQAVHQVRSHVGLLDRELDISIWGRSAERAGNAARQLPNVNVVDDLAAACEAAQIIVTVTAAKEPIIRNEWVQKGTHITAVGADAPGKQELDPDLLNRANVLAADSRSQCLDHGELSACQRDDVVELGEILNGSAEGRTDNDQITVADLTGIAAQDIAIASVVLNT